MFTYVSTLSKTNSFSIHSPRTSKPFIRDPSKSNCPSLTACDRNYVLIFFEKSIINSFCYLDNRAISNVSNICAIIVRQNLDRFVKKTIERID